MTGAQPIYVSTDRDKLAGLFHPATGQEQTPVLICSPWGWDEVATYRVRKRWAEQLAGAGHPTLRFDLPAVGDSGGNPADSDLLGAWIGAVGTMGGWLADATGRSAVCGLGLGLGGLLLRAAVERGAPIDRLALWAAPSSGKSFVREARAFARLQTRSAEEVDDPVLPEGWLDVGGFVLSGSTAAELKALAPATTGQLRRALLLGRDGVAVDPDLVEHLKRAGIEVESGPGSGWGTMVNDARLAALPVETIAAFDAWLGMADAPATVSEPKLESEDSIPLQVGGKSISDRPITFDLDFGRAFGILTQADEAGAGPIAVFLNSGNVRHIGPNRLWVEEARRWTAGTGRPALRLDLEAIGEADGPESKEALFAADVGELYIPPFIEQVEAVLDSLEQSGLGSTFVLVGLCAGSYWAFQVAARDARVTSVVLLNAGALTWDDELLSDRGARGAEQAVRGALTRDSWRRLFHGELNLRWAGRHLASVAGRRLGGASRRGGRDDAAAARAKAIEAGFDRLRERGATAVLAFSGDEVMMEDLFEEGFVDRLAEWPKLELVGLPGNDHTLRSPAAQAAVHDLLAREMRRSADAASVQSGRQR